ncbi:carbamoyltransferase family protein [Leptospira sp. GIMC2001]|uniref:carbamoyltransferase family protein n=1 Tax=Leptospira sp. GIMC2001 TaxID=1513297 RepID=UPI002349277D|nr:carbamoyltransferase [Leptospira sp. GIMC2001]WCL49591.1 carbamoyltransferase [Leptospira sp. GIMC2001]
MSKNIIGISAYYHDSAAALIVDGKIIAAVQEERFSRKKHDSRFPTNAIKYCIEQAGISFSDIDDVVFYDKPLVKFERLLETYLAYAPKGILSFFAAMPVWIKEKLFLKSVIKKEFQNLAGKGNKIPRLLFNEHHQSHAASSFFVSPFESSVVLCMDGVGEWATSTVWKGEGNKLTPLWQIDFPHSLGLLYSAFTYYTGFKVNSGEYKVMGLAPYGEPKYKDLIYKHLLDVKEDGTFRLNMEYFNYATGLTMTNSKFNKIFGGPPRKPETKLGQKEMDLARSVQEVTEEVMVKICRSIQKETGAENLCMAGGVALNCVANGKILEEKIFKNIFIQPASGDAGGALGAALSCWYEYYDNKRTPAKDLTGSIDGSYLGTSFDTNEIKTQLDKSNAKYEILSDEQLNSKLAEVLADGNVVGYFQGRMEFGPRALGARSIIGDPRNTKMQSVMNLKIKYRESFRPFAPAVLAERVSDYFDIDSPSPYMLIVAPLKEKHRIPMTAEQEKLFGIEKLNVPRSTLPAITHVDYSARIQTVHKETNPKFYNLLTAFDKKTGCPVLVNTSFNVRGEPIVNTPEDAFRCFMRTEMDYLVVENFLMDKKQQIPWEKDDSWKDEFELD